MKKNIFKSLVGILLVVLRGVIGFFAGAIGLLAASTNTSEKQDDVEGGDLTGVYNFRTRKYDNGTDPYGWYEEDL
jgi:hypothetical protein